METSQNSKSICAFLDRNFLDWTGTNYVVKTQNGQFIATLESVIREDLTREIERKQIAINKSYRGTNNSTLQVLKSMPWPNPATINVAVQFKDQPYISMFTGFHIGEGLVVTAGHCVEDITQLYDYIVVFDFTSDYKSPRAVIPQEKVFEISRYVRGLFYYCIRTSDVI
jgi:V8-like Glu-specific endopeptidase